MANAVRCDRPGVPNPSLTAFTEERSGAPAVHRVDGDGQRIDATVIGHEQSEPEVRLRFNDDHLCRRPDPMTASAAGRTDLPAGPARSGAARPGQAADGTA